MNGNEEKALDDGRRKRRLVQERRGVIPMTIVVCNVYRIPYTSFRDQDMHTFTAQTRSRRRRCERDVLIGTDEFCHLHSREH